MEMAEEPVRRQTDTSNAEARGAIQATLAQFSAWRSDLARYAVQVERRLTEAERAAMLARCDEIERQLLEARTDLLIGLADAPQKVAGHSRVGDVEKALDGVAANVAQLRQRLQG